MRLCVNSMDVLINTLMFMYILHHLINVEKKEKRKQEKKPLQKIKGHFLEQNCIDDRTVTQSSLTCRKLLSHKGHEEYLISI